MWGLTVEEAARDSGPSCEVWPDNLAAVNVFIAASTQWAVGMGGPTGLSYQGLESTMRMLAVPRRDWPEIFDAIRIMEDAALETMRKSQK